MKIAVCISQVPDTESNITISTDSKNLDLDELDYIINPYDEYALEEALKTKEIFNGEVIVISAGADKNKDALKKALAIGANKAVHLKTNESFDSLNLAKLLYEEIKTHQPVLVFFGKQSADYSNSVTGQITAQLLNYNLLSNVSNLEISENRIIAEREIDGWKEKVSTTFPAVITAEKGLNTPRYPSLKGIMTAKKKPFIEKVIENTLNCTERIELKRPKNKSAGKVAVNSDEGINGLISFLQNEVKIL
ncbi:MAG: electron transfer flavoprotein subunit beta/FixA family protein [Melioribacteraceae bacterium]|nr:electron transfer flavoprotein subunit beta/FixA family protein [Melioribacteraceae bacterium]